MNCTWERLQRRRRRRKLRGALIIIGIVALAGLSLVWRGESTLRTSSSLAQEPGGQGIDGAELAFLPREDGMDEPADHEGALDGVGGPEEGEELPGRGRVPIFVHEVRPGETLSQIAAAYGVDVATIAVANQLVHVDRIRAGERLEIPGVPGALHTVRRGESLWDIARTYGVSVAAIAETNGLERPDRIQVGQRLVVPGAQALAYALQRDAVVGPDGKLLANFDWPVRGRITSRFGPRWGRMHNGIDIAVPTGTPVRAAAAGRVTFSGWGGGYGYLVVIDHGQGVETRYAHNSRLAVQAGQKVKRGQVIAYSGNTGHSTGPHLHLEIRRNGQPLNPEKYLRR